MNVVGEIVFSNQLAVEMLEENIIKFNKWFWDSTGFYMDSKGNNFIIIIILSYKYKYIGIAFIKFQK